MWVRVQTTTFSRNGTAGMVIMVENDYKVGEEVISEATKVEVMHNQVRRYLMLVIKPYVMFFEKKQEEASDAAITGTILVYDRMNNILYYLGSSYSYVYMRFSSKFKTMCDVLDAPIHVSNPVGDLVIVTHVYRACPTLFMIFQTWIHLVISYMTNFDIIVGMTWCSPLSCYVPL